MILRSGRALAAFVFLPGVVFAVANVTAPAGDAASAATGVAAVGLSGAVAAGVLVKPSRPAYLVAFVWSAFSVVFEITQARGHHRHGADGRATLSLVLGVVRLTGVALSAQLAAGRGDKDGS